MDEIENLKKVVNESINIPFINPVNLENLAKNFKDKDSDKFPDIQSSFEFPPKPINTVINYYYIRNITN